MSRSPWKVPYIPTFIFSKKYMTASDILIWERSLPILSTFADKRIFVYNGTWFLSLNITSKMTGLKAGEISLSKRVNDIHSTKKKKKKKGNKKK